MTFGWGGGSGGNVCSRFDNGILSGRVWIVPTHIHAHTDVGTHAETHTGST